MSDSHSDPLCCCEYFDKDGHRNHIVTCCCNCVELDSAVDSVLCCRKGKNLTWAPVHRTMEDRMRIPWIGGARQISLDAILPVALLPIILLLSSLHAICTAIILPATPFLIFQIHKSYLQYIPHTKFYGVWTCMSFLLIFLIYEFEVVPFLEISVGENSWFMGYCFMAALGLYKVKTAKGKLLHVDEESGEMLSSKCTKCSSCGLVALPRSGHCRLCQLCIPKREVHCIWFGCCIGSHNLLWFLFGLIFLAISLIYSSSLILTTVCRPVPLVAFVLMPEDCSEVYYELRYALCFVSGLYSLVISVLVIWALLRQCWLITLGMTGNEWRSMTLSDKLRLGITANRPFSRGPILNWLCLLLCKNENN